MNPLAQQFEKASKASVVERKIRVNWLPSDAGVSSQQSQANESVSCSAFFKPCAPALTFIF